MDERVQFVARRLAGEPMSELCREFGISRKTGSTISGWSALWIMIWDTSIWIRVCWNHSITRSAQVVTHVAGTFCYPCVRAGPRENGRP